MDSEEQAVIAAIDAHGDWISQQPGVVGCADGTDRTGRPCVKVYTDGASAQTKDAIRRRLQGVSVEFEETGAIEAL